MHFLSRKVENNEHRFFALIHADRFQLGEQIGPTSGPSEHSGI